LVPACALLPSCAGVSVPASRKEAAFLRARVAHHIFPVDYEPLMPTYPGPQECLAAARRGERAIAVLRATPARLRDAGRWIAAHSGGRRLLTITLRGYSYMPKRNSNVAAWASFAARLDPATYFPVVIPDVNQTINGLPAELSGLTVC